MGNNTALIIEHLRKAQKHLSHAESRLSKAGLEAYKSTIMADRIWDWQRITRELQVALYQEGIKALQE